MTPRASPYRRRSSLIWRVSLLACFLVVAASCFALWLSQWLTLWGAFWVCSGVAIPVTIYVMRRPLSPAASASMVRNSGRRT